MAVCININEIGLELDKELNTVLQKNYKKKKILETISKKRTWKSSSYIRKNEK